MKSNEHFLASKSEAVTESTENSKKNFLAAKSIADTKV